MLQTKTSSLLKEIQSGELEWAYYHVTDKAVEWSICGLVDEGIRLLEILWGFGIEHSKNLWLKDEGLQMLWMVANKQPSKIPYSFKDVDEIENESLKGMFLPRWSDEYMKGVLEKPLEQLKGHELYVRTILEEHNSSLPDEEILSLFDKCIESGQEHASLAAFYFAANSGLEQEAERYLVAFGRHYLKHPTNYILAELMRTRKCASVLLNGGLASVFNVSKEQCEIEIGQIKETLQKRLSVGRTLVYGQLSWYQLLKEMSVLAVEQNTNGFEKEQRERKWLGFDGTSYSQVKEAEDRLGVALPEDYKEFLKATNGFASLSNIDVTLLPVEKIDYLKVLDRELVEIWTRDPDRGDFNHQFSSSILVGGYQEEQQLLLVPVSESGWECWFFSTWSPGETKYPSFRFYMEEVLTWFKEGFFNF